MKHLTTSLHSNLISLGYLQNIKEMSFATLYNMKHGLKINIIRISERTEYVALRPGNVEEPLLLHVFNDINDNSKIGDSALVLYKEILQGIVPTMDSEWDKLCLESYYGQYTPGTKCKALVLILITFPP